MQASRARIEPLLAIRENNESWFRKRTTKEGMQKTNEEKKCCTCGVYSLREAVSELEAGNLSSTTPEELLSILRTCRSDGDRTSSLRLHAYIRWKGMESHTLLGNYVVPLLVKEGHLSEARQVFDKLIIRHDKSWNMLMAGYCKSKNPRLALWLFQQMRLDGSVSLTGHTLVALLKSCAKLKDLEACCSIHYHIGKQDLLDHDPFLGSTLVDAYIKCGSLAKAQQVFDKLENHCVISWTALISGYILQDRNGNALSCFEQMQLEGVEPNAHTYVCCLKACGNIRALHKIQELHAQVQRNRLLDNDPFLGSTLISIYSKCCLLAKAQNVFNSLPMRDVVTWTALISGYVEHDYGEEAINCFKRMQMEGISPSTVTYISVLKACSCVAALDTGREIHSEIERMGLIRNDLVIGNALVDMYAKCGYIAFAKEVFEKLPSRDVISWTVLIKGCADHGHEEEALECFGRMKRDGISATSVTFLACLKACCSLDAVDKLQELHAEIERKGLLERDIVLANTLIDMYGKQGLLVVAQELFNKLPARDVVTWTALIAGYADYGYGAEAIRCFEQMIHDRICPNAVTIICSLKACTNIGAIGTGQMIHAEIKKHANLKSDLVVNNTLLDMYAKCGLLNVAQELFDELPVRDMVSWTILMTGYAEHEHGEEVLKCFESMQHDGLLPDSVVFICILKACSITGATLKGIQVHMQIERQGLLQSDLAIGNTLIDMYAKCGSLARAHQVFDTLQIRDVVSWNALLSGYAQSGQSDSVFYYFDTMLGVGVEPDLVSFLIVMCSCSRAGLLYKSKTYFESMTEHYGVPPSIQHHACIVDILGRTGEVDKAVEMIKKMPFSPNLVLWHTILGASRFYGNAIFGEQAFRNAMHLNKKNPVSYIMMSHITALKQ